MTTKTTTLPTEKQIGDFTLRVVADASANGPFAIEVLGGPAARTLACRFASEDDAAAYLSRVTSRSLSQFFAGAR
jgi:hypothetical protein